MIHHRPALCGVVLGLILGLLPGCGFFTPPDRSPVPYDGPTEPEVKAERIFGPVREYHLDVVALLNDGVVISHQRSPGFLIGTDGRERWRLPEKVKLSDRVTAASLQLGGQIVAENPGSVIAGAYTWNWCEAHPGKCYRDHNFTVEYGVTGLSATDGKPIWSTVFTPSERGEPDRAEKRRGSKGAPHVEVSAAAAILASVSTFDAVGSRTQVEAVALDPATGAKLWSRFGFDAERAAGELIFGRLLEPGSGDPAYWNGYPVVLEARTGREVWRGADLGTWQQPGGPNAAPVAPAGYGVVYPPNSGSAPDHRAVVVEPATGTTFPFDGRGVVGRDATGLYYAWVAGDGYDDQSLSRPLGAGKPQAGPEQVDSTGIEAAVDGLLWADARGAGQSIATVAFDRSGARRAAVLPGNLEAVGENLLVLYDTVELRLTVYRLIR